MKTHKKKNRRTRRSKRVRKAIRKTRKMKGGMNNPVIPVIQINPLQGATPLMIAAMNGNIVEVKRLIAEGVDLNPTNAHGDTALILAIWHDQRDVVPVLLTGDCNLDIKGAHDGTALMHAVMKRDVDIVKLLAVAGANLNLKDDVDDTALIMGAKLRRHGRDVVRELIADGADLNLENANGDTALMVVSTPPFVRHTVLRLLEAGADVRPGDGIAKTNINTWIRVNTTGDGGALQEDIRRVGDALVAVEQRYAEAGIGTELFSTD